MDIIISMAVVFMLAVFVYALCEAASDADDTLQEIMEAERKRKDRRDPGEDLFPDPNQRRDIPDGADAAGAVSGTEGGTPRRDCINCPDKAVCNCHYRQK